MGAARATEGARATRTGHSVAGVADADAGEDEDEGVAAEGSINAALTRTKTGGRHKPEQAGA